MIPILTSMCSYFPVIFKNSHVNVASMGKTLKKVVKIRKKSWYKCTWISSIASPLSYNFEWVLEGLTNASNDS